MIYFCCEENRRNEVKGHASLNGIEYLEVLDNEAPADSPRQRTLLVQCLNPIVEDLRASNVQIDGGERVKNIGVEWAFPAPQIPAGILNPQEQLSFSQFSSSMFVIRTDTVGDFSTYRLQLVHSENDLRPPGNFDSRLSELEFSFKVDCGSDFDCKPSRICPSDAPLTQEIDYLAKDFSSFRRLMLDRIALLSPKSRLRNPADLRVALVEMLAYVGDYLSYQQDAIGTEAYLGTARKRISVRRHARLVDYFMHDGNNSRCWVQILVKENAVRIDPTDPPLVSKSTKLTTHIENQSVILSDNFELTKSDVVFETMEDLDEAFKAHNKINFYTFGDRECCLPKGATSAFLIDDFLVESESGGPTLERLRLVPGDVLIFEERVGPKTGFSDDADPTRRHAVRLTKVNPPAMVTVDPDTGRTIRHVPQKIEDRLNGQAYVEIEWSAEDALPFPFCVSSRTDREHEIQYVDEVSVALGNIVLADHGLTIESESIGNVPDSTIFKVAPAADDRCEPPPRNPIPPRFSPTLQKRPLTQAAPSNNNGSAQAAIRQELRKVVPFIKLNQDNVEWCPKRDLLNSNADANDFVVEIESDGATSIRFGDDVHGRRPEAGQSFTAAYRVGNGVAGNVGAESLFHIFGGVEVISGIRNPLPAAGGIEPESIQDVRQRAPSAFRTQERAVTEKDYADVTERHHEVQKAGATFRWTGSWHTAFVTVDRLSGLGVTEQFEEKIREHIEPFRMAGHDLEIDAPQFVSLEIELLICVEPSYFRSHVKEALLKRFNNRLLADGTRGVFHPDNFTFGQTVYASRIIAEAQSVTGVSSVTVMVFRRQGSTDPSPPDDARLTLGRLEIARLDNDPNFPEHGIFRLKMEGGK